MIIDNKRALAYTQLVHTIQPIEGADNIELVHCACWSLITKKGEFKEGDICVYFEIDSKLPEEERYEFLANKHYKVKTYKLGKFNVVSQGLALPLESFPEIPKDVKVLTDVTELLKVTYSVKEDNYRKENDPRVSRFNEFKRKHKKFFESKFGQFLMRHKLTRKILFKIGGGKKARKWNYPSFITKTDEERIQNCPELLQIKTPFVVTEKIDGTSTTVTVERVGLNKFKTYVCSRNVCFENENQKCYMNNDNIYWEMTHKYNLDDFLIDYLKEHKDLKWACIQGESFILPDTVDELIQMTTGPADINPDVLREGWVIRGQDGTMSFKTVSTEYLLKKGE